MFRKSGYCNSPTVLPRQPPDGVYLLIDGEGRVLGSVRFPGAFWDTPMGRPAAIGPDGSLYTIVFEPYPHVRRYRVELHR